MQKEIQYSTRDEVRASSREVHKHLNAMDHNAGLHQVWTEGVHNRLQDLDEYVRGKDEPFHSPAGYHTRSGP